MSAAVWNVTVHREALNEDEFAFCMWRRRTDWLLVKLYYQEWLYDLFSMRFIYIIIQSIFILSIICSRGCAVQREKLQFSSIYPCKLLCSKWGVYWGFSSLKHPVPTFKAQCGILSFISVAPRALVFSALLETVESQKATTVLKPNHSWWLQWRKMHPPTCCTHKSLPLPEHHSLYPCTQHQPVCVSAA